MRISEVKMGKNCCTCLARIENDDAPVLAMGAYGTPKLLCPSCASLVDTITIGRDYDEIASAMNEITARMSAANVDDRVTVETMTELLKNSAERAQKIKQGEYDFALDEALESESDEGFDDIPEELKETEEDRLLDEKDAETLRKFDKVLNWLWAGVGVFAMIVIIIKLVQRFL